WGFTNITEVDLSETIKLRNIASFGRTTFRSQQAVDATAFPILDTPSRSIQPSRREQMTEELQLQGTLADGQLDFILGGFYLDDDQPAFGQIETVVFGGAGTTSTRIGASSRALYGQFTYTLV